jgi:nucleoside-triphosphatase
MTVSRRSLLLTGPPGGGKTTVVRRVADGLADRRICGFVTEEIRVKGERQGFRLETFDGRSAVLAHVSNRSGPRVGKYGVNVPALEGVVEAALDPKAGADFYLVDEIGRMECLSEKFIAAMRRLLDSGKPVVATVARRGAGFIEHVKRRADVEVWQVTRSNRDKLPEKIISWLGSELQPRRVVPET